MLFKRVTYLLLVFISLIVASCLFSKTVTAQQSNVCVAANNIQLRTCLAQAKIGSVHVVEITGQIECTTLAPCKYEIVNFPQPILIKGTSASAGFLRSSGYQNEVLKLVLNSKQVIIRDLFFKDATNIGCKAEDKLICADSVFLQDNLNVFFHNVKFIDINRLALDLNFINKAGEYVIQNSSFTNIGLHGVHSVYTDLAPKGGVVKIINNVFENSKSSAINLSVNSATTNPSIVSGNIVSRTHNTPMYFTCFPHPEGRCSGGQVFVYAPIAWKPAAVTENVIVEKNLIQNGITNTGISVWGVEVFHHNLKNITVRENVIIDQDACLYLSGTSNVSASYVTNNVTISNNTFTNCRTFPDFSPGILYFNSIPPVISNNNLSLTKTQSLTKFNTIRPPAPPPPVFTIPVQVPSATPSPQRTPTSVPSPSPVPTLTLRPTNTPVITRSPQPTSVNRGDINGDGKANIIDIGIVTDSYYPLPLNNPNADINRDGRANILDIGIIVDNYSTQ